VLTLYGGANDLSGFTFAVSTIAQNVVQGSDAGVRVALRINNEANVGIGTATPAGSLHIKNSGTPHGLRTTSGL